MDWTLFILIAIALLTIFAAVYLIFYLHQTEAGTLAKWSAIWILLLMVVLIILVAIGVMTPSDCAEIQPVPSG